MTPDQLRALINQCATLPDGRIEIDRSDMAEIALDALRFSHIVHRNAHVTHDAGWVIGWRRGDSEGMTLRAAIDADMGEAP